LDERNDQLAQRDLTVASLLDANQVLTMEGTEAAPDVRAALVVLDDEVVVVANNVPEPEPGTAYHLFLFREGVPEVHAILEAEDGEILATLEADLSEYDAMEVDVLPLAATEPGGTTVVGGELN
jgi:hypothetical protein